jgi:predicted RNase H-like HicB family nuclease
MAGRSRGSASSRYDEGQHPAPGWLEGTPILMKYVVVLEQTPRNWAAYLPDLPGCIATGATRAEVEENIRGAVRMHLRSMLRDGDPLPEPGTWTTTVDVDVAALGADVATTRAVG